ncbi:MAG: N-acetyltransferase [Henriciella sp.]|nr:N-acetyltransferase [Henriciella sp.]
MIEILPETPALHAEAIEALYDRTFGPGHFAKTAERLREGTLSLPALSRVALQDGRLIAACRLWPLEVGAERLPAVFVGPVAVSPDFQGQRLGLTVTGEALEAATEADWPAAVIIGAPGYFGELGFQRVAPGTLIFPGPQDPNRIMVRDLAGKASDLFGAVRVPLHPERYL